MRRNEGYDIIVSVPLNREYEVVIGENADGRYVVWTCRNSNDYFWGHYVSNYKQALKELIRKIELEIK